MANERRLIDANVVVKKIEDEIKTQCKPVASSHKGLERFLEEVLPMLLRDVINYINQQPTVDAVEVVRCEKCLYRSQYPDENGDYKCGGLLTEDEELLLMVKPDFFCAYGERRADEGRNSSV